MGLLKRHPRRALCTTGNIRNECTAFYSRGLQRAPRSEDRGPDCKTASFHHRTHQSCSLERLQVCALSLAASLGPGPGLSSQTSGQAAVWVNFLPTQEPSLSLSYTNERGRWAGSGVSSEAEEQKFQFSFPGLALPPGKSACLRMCSYSATGDHSSDPNSNKIHTKDDHGPIPITVFQQSKKKKGFWKHAERHLPLSKCFKVSLLISKIGIMPISWDFSLTYPQLI